MREGYEVRYYANGSKMSEGAYRNDRKHGLWVLYWPNGNKKSEATFVDGLYTGLYTCYHRNGQIQWQGMYNAVRGTSADGTKDGVWLTYDESGALVRRITYKRGSRARPDEFAPFDDDGG